jgi:signal transduction histidine kinase
MSEAAPDPNESWTQIPSPTRRLWIGLGVILSIFIIFTVYIVHEVRWLQDFQVNVVQRNRKASLQLLRMQNDVYSLAISLRGMTDVRGRYPIVDWHAEFNRLEADMADALNKEAAFAGRVGGAADKQAQLQRALPDFWQSLDLVFELAAAGHEEQARRLAQTEVENKRAVVSEIVSRLLILNDQAQAQAADTINAVYDRVQRRILLVMGILLLMALGTGLYTLQANRRTFEQLQHLAERLQEQSEQLRNLSWKLIQVQEDTLRQVSRDLHDEFGQILTAMGTLLGGARRKTADPGLLKDLEAVRGIAHETLARVRDQSQMFRPAILDDFGLLQTLEWFTRQYSRQSGIQVHFETDRLGAAALAIAPEDAIHLYRIVQEGLNNVSKHAQATEAWVSVRQQDGRLELVIRDDGRGFEVNGEARKLHGGVGLMGMRERAEHLRGTFEVRSQPGKGTTVRVRVPASTAHAAPEAAVVRPAR